YMDRKSQIFTGLEEIQFFFEQQRIGAEVNIFLAGDEAFDDFIDLRVHERFAAGYGNHGRAALFHGLETLFRGEFLFQDVSGILDFSTAGASEIAAEKRLEHQDKRVALAPFELLLQDVARNRKCL